VKIQAQRSLPSHLLRDEGVAAREGHVCPGLAVAGVAVLRAPLPEHIAAAGFVELLVQARRET
jgi:hypothetical protein